MAVTDVLTDARDDWLRRVVGFKVPRPATGIAAENVDFPRQWDAAMAAWRDGVGKVDGEIETLGKLLTSSPDERLRAISQTGMNAITGNHKVRTMAALHEVTGATAGTLPKLAARAETQVLDFMLHLSRDARVAACDDNPFGVAVTVRATLVPLLQRLDSLLAGVAGS